MFLDFCLSCGYSFYCILFVLKQSFQNRNIVNSSSKLMAVEVEGQGDESGRIGQKIFKKRERNHRHGQQCGDGLEGGGVETGGRGDGGMKGDGRRVDLGW